MNIKLGPLSMVAEPSCGLDEPTRLLLVAILEQAVIDYLGGQLSGRWSARWETDKRRRKRACGNRTMRHQHESAKDRYQRQAEIWIKDASREIFRFEMIAEALYPDVDPDALRRRILALRSNGQLKRGTTRAERNANARRWRNGQLECRRMYNRDWMRERRRAERVPEVKE